MSGERALRHSEAVIMSAAVLVIRDEHSTFPGAFLAPLEK